VEVKGKNLISVYEYMYYMHKVGLMVDYNTALMRLRGDISFMQLLAQTDIVEI